MTSNVNKKNGVTNFEARPFRHTEIRTFGWRVLHKAADADDGGSDDNDQMMGPLHNEA